MASPSLHRTPDAGAAEVQPVEGQPQVCGCLNQLIDLRSVVARVGFSRATVYGGIRRGEFPQPVKVFGRSRWIEREVQAFIDGLPRKDAAR
jgi:predicted DNA-binding transcriptional regulator AlpA